MEIISQTPTGQKVKFPFKGNVYDRAKIPAIVYEIWLKPTSFSR